MSYLDDPRVLFAAERTLLAWQRTAIALMGFGFVVERFGLFLRMVTTSPCRIAARVLAVAGRGFAPARCRRVRDLGPAIPNRHARARREGDPARLLDHLGVWLNFVLAFVALALAVHFVTSAG